MTPDEKAEPPGWYWELAVATNAALKGLLGAQCQSGHICARAVPVPIRLDLEKGWVQTKNAIAEALRGQVQRGDVLVVADKVIAAALGRIAPAEILSNPDPKTVGRDALPQLAARWERALGVPVKPVHLLLADEYGEDRATLGCDAPNRRAGELATAVREETGVAVDVVISDTDTGIDTRTPLIGTLTLGATPLGATRALNLYECMRCAVAAEFVRGHDRGIPVVRCVPAERRRQREDLGERRDYDGVLDASREPGIAHA